MIDVRVNETEFEARLDNSDESLIRVRNSYQEYFNDFKKNESRDASFNALLLSIFVWRGIFKLPPLSFENSVSFLDHSFERLFYDPVKVTVNQENTYSQEITDSQLGPNEDTGSKSNINKEQEIAGLEL